MDYQFDSCSCLTLAKRYGTPLYVISERMVRDRLSQLHAAVHKRTPKGFALYAAKALLTVEMCHIVADEGVGLDVVSGGELYTAYRAGFPMKHVYFHGNNKSKEELELAVQYGVGRIVVDNTDELELLCAITDSNAAPVDILFRITPGVDSHTHEYISTGQIDSKFGIPLVSDSLERAVTRAISSAHVNPVGFHFHVGSQLFTNESHRKATAILFDVIQRIRDHNGFVPDELDLGGGYGVWYTNDDAPQSLEYFVDALWADVDRYSKKLSIATPRIIIEPGRWVVAEAGVTLYTVGSVKEIPGVRTYVAVDGGMTDNPRPALYNANYSALIADRPDDPAKTLVTVAGKCCESGDILIHDIHLQNPKPGDTMVVLSTGAYNFSMASNYNRLPRPALVMTNNGRHRLSVRRETYEDLVAREVVDAQRVGDLRC
ncbi:MAG: diaminopimelate decarboxylase [Spirochaetaceae bacterium]|nr:MAG: diaminopimelate decarboxylase [Spirochaetaceae bacterium]